MPPRRGGGGSRKTHVGSCNRWRRAGRPDERLVSQEEAGRALPRHHLRGVRPARRQDPDAQIRFGAGDVRGRRRRDLRLLDDRPRSAARADPAFRPADHSDGCRAGPSRRRTAERRAGHAPQIRRQDRGRDRGVPQALHRDGVADRILRRRRRARQRASLGLHHRRGIARPGSGRSRPPSASSR